MDIPTTEQLLARIEGFCSEHQIAKTRFGRDATGEPQLIDSLRSGRSPSIDTAHRILSFMANYSAGTAGDEQPELAKAS